MDVGLQIKVDLMVSELKISASLAANVLKAHGGNIEKAKVGIYGCLTRLIFGWLVCEYRNGSRTRRISLEWTR